MGLEEEEEITRGTQNSGKGEDGSEYDLDTLFIWIKLSKNKQNIFHFLKFENIF